MYWLVEICICVGRAENAESPTKLTFCLVVPLQKGRR